MSTSPEPLAKTQRAFSDSKLPTLAVELIQGRRYGWPLAVVISWELLPDNLTPDKRDLLKIEAGRHLLEVRGTGLRQILDVLEQGAGGMLREIGPRYAALSAAGGPHIDSIKVTETVSSDGGSA